MTAVRLLLWSLLPITLESRFRWVIFAPLQTTTSVVILTYTDALDSTG